MQDQADTPIHDQVVQFLGIAYDWQTLTDGLAEPSQGTLTRKEILEDCLRSAEIFKQRIAANDPQVMRIRAAFLRFDPKPSPQAEGNP